MRKISAMYEWSGGVDYRHTCHECNVCIQVKDGKRTVHKCLSYGTEGPETDWNEAYIACKAFGAAPPPVPVVKLVKSKQKELNNEEIHGQMSLFDFM